MKKKYSLLTTWSNFITRLFIILFFSLCSLFPAIIEHEVISSTFPGNAVEIKAYIDAPESRLINNVFLMYKNDGQINFIESPLEHIGGNQFLGKIPGYFTEESNVQYFIVTEFSDGGLLSLPADNPYANPFLIEVPIEVEEKGEKLSPSINPGELSGLETNALIMSPMPNSIIPSDEVYIILSYFSMSNVDPQSIKLFIDEIDISHLMQRSPTHINLYYPQLKKGRHRIRIEMKNNLGQLYNPIQWEFNTIDPIQINWISQMMEQRGKVWSTYSTSTIDGFSNSIQDLNLMYEADLDWMRVKVKGLRTSLDDSEKQTRNRYSFTFRNDNIKFYLGDFFPRINKYAMNGNKVRGVGTEVKYKFFNFNFIKGELAHEIQGNVTNNSMLISNYLVPQNDENGVIYLSRDNYTFKRDIYALKMGMGIPQKLYFNLDLIKAKDNTLSIYNYLPGAEIEIPTGLWENVSNQESDLFYEKDSSHYIIYENLKSNLNSIFTDTYELSVLEKHWEGNKPKDNFILGSDVQFSFDKNRVKINTGFTFSLLNQNIWESITTIEELDTLAADSVLDGKFMGLHEIPDDFLTYSDLFELGINQVPLIPFDISEDATTLSKIFNMPSMVYHFESKMNYAGHQLAYKYVQIGPEFNSLVNPYIQTNTRLKEFSDRVRAMGNRMILSVKYSKKEDGIEESDENSIFTTKYEGNLGFYPGAGLPTFNFGFNSNHRKSEKERIDQIIIENEDESTENDTIITDDRVETLTKQLNISITNTFNFIGENQLSLNLFTSDKEDVIFEKKLDYNEDYYSPQSQSENMSLSMFSRHSTNWDSNISYSKSSFSSGVATDAHPEYLHEQDISRLSFKLIRKKYQFAKNMSATLNFAWGEGNTGFSDNGLTLSGVHSIFKVFQLNWYYGINRKTINESNTNLNTSFRAKLLYTL